MLPFLVVYNHNPHEYSHNAQQQSLLEKNTCWNNCWIEVDTPTPQLCSVGPFVSQISSHSPFSFTENYARTQMIFQWAIKIQKAHFRMTSYYNLLLCCWNIYKYIKAKNGCIHYWDIMVSSTKSMLLFICELPVQLCHNVPI